MSKDTHTQALSLESGFDEWYDGRPYARGALNPQGYARMVWRAASKHRAALAAAEAQPTKAERVHAIVNAGPYPGMSEAFDAHMGAACWTDPAYAPDASTWAAAWKAAKAQPDHIADAGKMVARQAMTDQQATLLNQAHDMLLSHADEQRQRGNDSAAAGAECSASAVLELAAAWSAAQPVAVPQGVPLAWRFQFPTSTRWHYTEHGPHEASRPGLKWEALHATPAAQPVAVPQGWKLVPVEPTDAMLDASCLLGEINSGSLRGAWRDMLAAAPAAPAPVALTDEQVVEGLEKHGVKFQRFIGGISGTKDCWSTAGSQDVRKLASGVRALMAPAAPAPALVPLTRDQIAALDAGCGQASLHWDTRVSLARAVERAHGIGGKA